MEFKKEYRSMRNIGPKVEYSNLDRIEIEYMDGSKIIVNANAEEEQWKPINRATVVDRWLGEWDYEEIEKQRYFISNYGNIIDTKRNKKLKPSYQNGPAKRINGKVTYPHGHARVSLHLENGGTLMTYLPSLVMDAFGKGKKKLQVDHIDTDPHNNYVGNLQYATPKENQSNPLTKYNRQFAYRRKNKTKPII